MKRRRIGRNGPEVSALGLGCMGMSFAYGTPDDAESLATLHHALDRGVDFFDTAQSYAAGRNEELVGRGIRERRKDVVLATKFGILPDARGLDARPETVRASCEASLRRLGVDVIDLYYLHRVDPNVPIEETVGAMGELVAAGKVRWLGLSELGPDKLRRAHATHPITALQSEYSLWERRHEEQVIPTCRELGIGFVPFSPLGRGFLTGTLAKPEFGDTDFRRYSPRFQGEHFDRNLAIVARIREIAAAKSVTAAQLAIAWVLAQGEDIVPIPGTKRRKYLDENLGALDVELSKEDLARIDEAAPRGAASGDRYNSLMESWVDH
jgi:aryl-alcohol dehydrogenase-like predicted oxidoreductase